MFIIEHFALFIRLYINPSIENGFLPEYIIPRNPIYWKKSLKSWYLELRSIEEINGGRK